MYKKLIAVITFFICVQTLSAQQDNKQKKHVGVKELLEEFYDISSLPSYVPDVYAAEVSTYDRTGLNNDGFAGTYSYLRKNPDGSLVIFDIKGKGVINRI